MYFFIARNLHLTYLVFFQEKTTNGPQLLILSMSSSNSCAVSWGASDKDFRRSCKGRFCLFTKLFFSKNVREMMVRMERGSRCKTTQSMSPGCFCILSITAPKRDINSPTLQNNGTSCLDESTEAFVITIPGQLVMVWVYQLVISCFLTLMYNYLSSDMLDTYSIQKLFLLILSTAIFLSTLICVYYFESLGSRL